MMNPWNQAPLVRLLIPFITGILTAVYLPYRSACFIFAIALLLSLVAAIVLIPKYNISYRRSWWFGLALNLLLLLLAYQLTIFKTEKFSPDHFAHHAHGKTLVQARIILAPVEKERSFKIVAEISKVKQGETWINTCGKVMLYLKKDTAAAGLRYGDELLLNTVFNDVPPPQNPGQFDYKRFLSFHNIFQQANAGAGSWIATGKNSGNRVLARSIDLRDKLLNILKEQNVSNDEYAVGAALLLGYADKLDADIISAYSSTGALHVLSVSGLHVAIVYVVFSWLLFFFDKIKYGHVIKAVILIMMLWFYSALTGLSPSVLRAATMFSFIIIAKAFGRHTNIYNTLAASAFLLLAINPYLIMEVGFQLSYTAVIGIVYIQPKIITWFEPDNWLLNQIWTITAVSIAAQIATFPMGLYYFHQFPNYFLISNFAVIPVSTVIMYAGIALFAFAKIPFIAVYLARGFSWSVWLLNASVKMIEQWPYALQEGISITLTETFLIYAMIALLFRYFIRKQATCLALAFSVMIALLVSQLIEQRQQFRQQKFIVYNIPKTSALDFISAKENVLLTDTAFAKNKSGLQFNIQTNWCNLGIDHTTIVSGNIRTNALNIHNNCIQFNRKRLLIINSRETINGEVQEQPFALDYIIISNNPKIRIADVLKKFHPQKIIFDSSNAGYRVNKWKAECIALQQMYYSVMDSGAYVDEM